MRHGLSAANRMSARVGGMALREFPADRDLDRLSSVQNVREVEDVGNEVTRK